MGSWRPINVTKFRITTSNVSCFLSRIDVSRRVRQVIILLYFAISYWLVVVVGTINLAAPRLETVIHAKYNTSKRTTRRTWMIIEEETKRLNDLKELNMWDLAPNLI